MVECARFDLFALYCSLPKAHLVTNSCIFEEQQYTFACGNCYFKYKMVLMLFGSFRDWDSSYSVKAHHTFKGAATNLITNYRLKMEVTSAVIAVFTPMGFLRTTF